MDVDLPVGAAGGRASFPFLLFRRLQNHHQSQIRLFCLLWVRPAAAPFSNVWNIFFHR